jgi:uracil DNA glycosylase
MNYIEQLFMIWGKQANNYGNILDVTIHDYQISVSQHFSKFSKVGFKDSTFLLSIETCRRRNLEDSANWPLSRLKLWHANHINDTIDIYYIL